MAINNVDRTLGWGANPVNLMYPSWIRRLSIGLCSWLAIGLSIGFSVLTSSVPAQDSWQRRASRGPVPQIGSRTSDRTVVAIDPATRRAIDRGLDYLLRAQNPDGSWNDRVGRKVHNTYRGVVAPHVGVTALAGLAFLASGSLPGQGPREKHCTAVHKALDFVMDQTQEHGFISANGSRMYSHAFATLFLAEAYGTGLYPNPDKLQDRLKRAVRLIVNSQNQLGGWRYLPLAPDADMSITVCQVMALRAARNAGITVPKETIARAVKYVTASFTRTTGSGGGAFYYQISPDNPTLQHRYSFALTACGVTTLYGAGEYNSAQVREGLLYLWHNSPPREYARNRFDYFYGQYYAIQAAFQAGGDYWLRWYEDVKNDLLALQETDGSWRELVGPNYATAMAAIILQMPNQYLPITENSLVGYNSPSATPLLPRRSLDILQALRVRIQQAFLFDGAVTLAGLVLVALAASFFADYLLTLPRGVRAVFLAAGGLGLAWGFRRRITAPLSLKLSDQDLANLVERANPELGQELITAVELTRSESEAADHVSSSLIDNVVRSVESKIASVSLDRVLALGRVKKKLVATAAGTLLALALAASRSDLVGTWFARNVLLGSERWPKHTQLELVRPVLPVRVAVGDALEIEVRAPRGVPPEVAVEYFTDGRNTHTDVLVEVAPGVFQQTVGNVSRPFSFRVHGGDDELDLVEVDVRLRPRIEMAPMRLWCEYPVYTGLERTPEDEPLRFGNLKVPTGTKVRYRMAANVPLSRAFFVFRGIPAPATGAPPAAGASAKPTAAEPAGAEEAASWPDAGAELLAIDANGEFAGAFEIKESGQYYFQLEAVDGFQSRRPDRFRVEAVPDQKPIVKLLEPERPTEEVTAEARIPVRVAASDDYRVQKVVLEGQYFVPGAEKGVEQHRDFQRWSAAAPPDGAPDVAPPPDGARNPRQPVEDELLVSVADLATGAGPPKPGGRFQFWAPAMDSAGQTASSEEHALLIVEKDDLLKILTDQLMLVRDQLKEVDRKQKSARKDLEEVQSKLALTGKIASTDAAKLLRHYQDQRRVTQALEREAAEMGRILARTLRNNVGDEAWRSWTTEVRDDVRTLAESRSPEIESTLETLRKEAVGTPQDPSRLGGAVSAQRDLEREVLSIVLRLSEFGDKNAQIQRLREIRRRLDEIRVRTRTNAQGTTPEEPQK